MGILRSWGFNHGELIVSGSKNNPRLEFSGFHHGNFDHFCGGSNLFFMLVSWRERLDLWIQNQCKDWEILINAPTYPTQKTGVN